MLLDSMNSDLTIDYVEKDIPEITHQYLDSTKIQKDTDWYAKTTLSIGLEKTIKMYEELL